MTSASPAATREDIDDVLGVLREFMQQTDNRFNSVDERFDKMDERFDKMDQRFDKMDERFDKMDQRFDGVDRRLDAMDRRSTSLEKSFESFSGEQIALSADVKDILRHLDKLDVQIESGQYKQKETEEKLIALHEWVIKAADKIGLEFKSS